LIHQTFISGKTGKKKNLSAGGKAAPDLAAGFDDFTMDHKTYMAGQNRNYRHPHSAI
jgi:hypothetical protein